jgi:hypothetical protein
MRRVLVVLLLCMMSIGCGKQEVIKYVPTEKAVVTEVEKIVPRDTITTEMNYLKLGWTICGGIVAALGIVFGLSHVPYVGVPFRQIHVVAK